MMKYFNESYNFDKGCNKFGVFGSNCNMTCPTNCRNDTCHIQNGNCYTCKPGWTGISCKTSKRYIDFKLNNTSYRMDSERCFRKRVKVDLYTKLV